MEGPGAWLRRLVRGAPALRPPGALPEPAFAARCIRCGRCAEVCAAAPRPRLAVLGALLALSALLSAPVAAILSPPRLVSALPLEAWSSRAVPWVTAGLLAGLVALRRR